MPPATTSLRSRASQQLRERVFSSPAGSLLSEIGLAREFGISRSWLRECVSELTNQGYLERSPGRGLLVTEKVTHHSTVRYHGSPHVTYVGRDTGIADALNSRWSSCRVQPAPISFEDADVRCVIGQSARLLAPLQMPVMPILERYPELALRQFRPDALEIFRIAGVQLALPLYVSPAVVHYNADHFAWADLPAPRADWTWDEFIACARRLHRPEEGRIGLAIAEPWRLFSALVWSLGGEIVPEGSTLWNLQTDAAHEAAVRYAELSRYAITYRPGVNPLKEFGAGRAAMAPFGGVLATNLGRSVPEWARLAPMPRGIHHATWIMAEGVGLGITCRNLDQAAALVREVVGIETQKAMVEHHLLMPGLCAAANDSAEQRFFESQMPAARMTWHLEHQTIVGVLGTQLSRLTDPAQAGAFCSHTQELINNIIQTPDYTRRFG